MSDIAAIQRKINEREARRQAPRLLCRALGHRPTVAIPRGITFVRGGVEYEAKPTEPARVACSRCGTGL